MVVCAHGEVAGFCEKHGIEILESYNGDLKDYSGSCAVIVTDQQMTREQYESLKCTMFGRGLEVISTEWTDDAIIVALLRQTVERRKKRGGRQMFGFTKKNGVIVEIPARMATARGIIEMRDSHKTLREIRERYGLSLSTIQTIINNRDKYERK
jgi:hypothetical protein